MKRRIPYLLVLAFVGGCGMTTPAAALPPEVVPLSVEANGAPYSMNNDTLVGARLPPASRLDVRFGFLVKMPTGSACLAASARIEFLIVSAPDDALAVYFLSTNVQWVQLEPDEQGAGTERPVSTVLSVTPTRDAAAFRPLAFKVKATAFPGPATSGCTLAPSNPVESTYQVTVDYMPVLEIQPAKYVMKGGQNKEVTFAVRLTNLGNAQTKVEMATQNVGRKPLEAVTPPVQVALESTQESGPGAAKSRDAIFTVRTPHSTGYTNSLYAFQATFDYTAMQGGLQVAKGHQALTLSVQVQGVYVPGFDAAGALAVLGIAVLVLGRTRRTR